MIYDPLNMIFLFFKVLKNSKKSNILNVKLISKTKLNTSSFIVCDCVFIHVYVYYSKN